MREHLNRERAFLVLLYFSVYTRYNLAKNFTSGLAGFIAKSLFWQQSCLIPAIKEVYLALQRQLNQAKANKEDEFYTQYADIQNEVNAYVDFNPDVFRDKTILLPCDDPEWSNFTKFFAQNFDRFGLKKLISTSFAPESKKYMDYQPSLFEQESPIFDEDMSKTHGKIFTLEKDSSDNRRDLADLKWNYLDGTGDFRSREVCKLRDEADFIITNPPFSLFRDFLQWILEADKKFLIIGNQNAITYKEVFPLLKDNVIWLGKKSGDMAFTVPSYYEPRSTRFWVDETGQKWRSMGNICWFTNIDLAKRHEYLSLMTMADNLKYSKHKEIKEQGYLKYDNYDAIEVPYTDAIPSDYEGVMGVPITFMDKYSPEQFNIVGLTAGNIRGLAGLESKTGKDGPYIGGKLKYGRIFIQQRRRYK